MLILKIIGSLQQPVQPASNQFGILIMSDKKLLRLVCHSTVRQLKLTKSVQGLQQLLSISFVSFQDAECVGVLALVLPTRSYGNAEKVLARHQPARRLMRVVADLVQRDQLVGERVRWTLVDGGLLVLEADGIVQVGRPLGRRQLVMMLQAVQVRRHRVDGRERRVRELRERLQAARVATFVRLVAGVRPNVLLQVRQLRELALADLAPVRLDAEVDARMLRQIARVGERLIALRTFVRLRLAHVDLGVQLKVSLGGEDLKGEEIR
uniref:Uncharacterized protein n=1 Tax=Anopheles atroparvus TaxID=41427 RepID=A0A182J4J8_ANOAO